MKILVVLMIHHKSHLNFYKMEDGVGNIQIQMVCWLPMMVISNGTTTWSTEMEVASDMSAPTINAVGALPRPSSLYKPSIQRRGMSSSTDWSPYQTLR